ncbi:MAG: hypothetical protein AB7O67_20935 [Vicinamibacterales bacterium]
MAEFNIRSESVDVEQIMQQIRTRIREKRGVDYTEEQVRELATVRLETFLDPRNLRSDLLEQFRKSRPALPAEPPPVEPPYGFDDQTLFTSHRGIIRFFRRLLRPILTLFFNPNTLNQILHTQAKFNAEVLEREQRRKLEFDRARGEWNTLYYEVLHNLVLETTRATIEVKNLKMRLESLTSRLEFSERRVRALEGVVQYRPEAVRPPRDRRPSHQPAPAEPALAAPDTAEPAPIAAPEGGDAQAGDGTSRRRRRRRRGRRGAGHATTAEGASAEGATEAGGLTLSEADDDDTGDEAIEARAEATGAVVVEPDAEAGPAPVPDPIDVSVPPPTPAPFAAMPADTASPEAEAAPEPNRTPDPTDEPGPGRP